MPAWSKVLRKALAGEVIEKISELCLLLVLLQNLSL